MDNPRKIMEFIERNELGYILGNAVRAIILAAEVNEEVNSGKNQKLTHLKDARLFLNVEIKRLAKETKTNENQ
jgi:hypothetical protein